MASKDLILYAGIAVGGYYLYTTMVQVPTGVPTTGVWNGYQPTGGGSRTSPKVGDTWLDGSGKVVATFGTGLWIPNMVPASTSTATQPVTTTPAGPSGILTPAPPVRFSPSGGNAPSSAPNSLDSIYAAMTAAAGPGRFAVDEWGYYLNAVLAPLGKSAPDPMPAFTSANAYGPSFDRSMVMSPSQYWSVMAPVLQQQFGLSGFRGLAGWMA
jgi:hypothetical protein